MNSKEKAAEVLATNDRGEFTVPSRGLYPYQWLWDAGFIAMGWSVIREARAWKELRALFRGQWADGFLPHIVFHQPDPNYFPGPDVWETPAFPPTSGITQPPILATAVLQLYRTARDRGLARAEAGELLPKLMAFHRWLYRSRDPGGTGLVSIVHPWESGMDNSPAWDEPLRRVPVAERALAGLRRKDTIYVNPAERPSDDDYQRYLSLVLLFKELGYEPSDVYARSPFRVIDVGFNAILHRANQDLRKLAVELGASTDEIDEWIHRTGQAFAHLWHEREGLYFSVDAITGDRIVVATSACFLPLFAGIPDPPTAARLASRLEAWGEAVTYLVPSTAPGDPRFDPVRYWRGPVWLNVNWMIGEGLARYGFVELARRVRADTRRLIALSGLREYYHPRTGQGLGGQDFSWSAAIALFWA